MILINLIYIVKKYYSKIALNILKGFLIDKYSYYNSIISININLNLKALYIKLTYKSSYIILTLSKIFFTLYNYNLYIIFYNK